jgi:dTDP-4-amino-4,6-dideoxygalactose transaminase
MISVFGSSVGEEEILQVSESIRNQWMGMGPKVRSFEEQFKARLGLQDFLMVDSGSNSLYMACVLLGLPPGSEIIVPSFTWIFCAHAVLLAGHKPVFCDVELESQNVAAEQIVPHLTPRTGAIMVVHYAGLPVDLDPILALGLPVIEDAAHAVDSRYRGRPCGGIGEVGIYSFDAIKNLAVGEGGGVTALDPGRMARARQLRYCGIGKSGFEASTGGKRRWWEYEIADVFIKMNPSDIAAGIGLAQMAKLDALQARRKEIWDYYQRELGTESWITLPLEARAGDRHSYFSYGVRVPHRDEFAQYLLEKGIYTTLRYHPLHLNPIYGQMDQRLPNCERLNEEALCIPLHPRLTPGEVEYVVATVKSFRSRT